MNKKLIEKNNNKNIVGPSHGKIVTCYDITALEIKIDWNLCTDVIHIDKNFLAKLGMLTLRQHFKNDFLTIFPLSSINKSPVGDWNYWKNYTDKKR